ncbi:MAG: hypothetical protein M3O03_03065 [Pseudomonadota bacterium]|nr:hypothetical protein [Pseudomonadota bacterium]
MKFLKLALLGTAALAAASVSARADTLDSLKAAMDNLNIGAVADAPAAAAPATVVVWNGFVRAGVTTFYNGAGIYGTDIRTYGEIKVTGKTETAVGEVGVDFQIQKDNSVNTAPLGNGNSGAVTTDGIHGWWKMTPNMTLSGGTMGTLAKSSYSWDANATNWWSAPTGGGVWGGIPNGDPAAVQLAYADGPLSFAVQVEDANNSYVVNNSASSFGVTGKVGYKMDAIGFDLNGGYWGNAQGTSPAYSVSGGVGYSAGAFSVGIAAGIDQPYAQAVAFTQTLGSAYAKINLSDVARFEIGATHDFGTSALDGSAGQTTVGAGLYYTPVKQLAFGVEAGYGTGNSFGTVGGNYTASLISQFMF